RALAGCFLLDADRGRQATDSFNLRFLQRSEKLTGIAREALDVSALPLGVERIDCERALARTAGPAANGHFVAGDIDVDALQIVLASAADLDRREQIGIRRRWDRLFLFASG